MSWARWLVICLVVVCSQLGCKNLLGIEERGLDVSEISEQGYDGCRPATNLCTACTSKWHTCICEGWNRTPEIELRRECAEQAPEAIRDDVEEAAEERYGIYISSLDEDGYSGCVPKRTRCDECVNEWHECLCEDWNDKPLPELHADCAELSPEAIRDEIEQEAEANLRDFLADNGETDSDGTDANGTDGGGTGAIDTDPDVQGSDPTGPSQLSDLEIFNEKFCESKPDDDCLGCFCGECGDEITECQSEFGCAAIADCFLEKQCDPFADGGTTACVDPTFCGDVVSEYPASLGLARSMFNCSEFNGCPCRSPNMGIAPCDPSAGCGTCPDCWERCFCEGKTDTQCQTECGSPQCTQDTACAVCNDCLDVCFCEGLGDRGYCTDYCRPGGAECTPEAGCNCDNCFDQCLCGGATWEACELQCGSQVVGGCDPIVGCDGCATCGGACYCSDSTAPFNECMLSCEIDGCSPGNCDACASCQTQCECEGTAPVDCLEQCAGTTCDDPGLNDCERCSCDQCTTLFGECEQHDACIELMHCFEETTCFDISDCNRPETCRAQIDALGGLDSPLLGVAEALQGCRLTELCACYGGGVVDPNLPPDISCGTSTCVPFVPPPPDPIAGACCAGSGGDLCGLDAGPAFGFQFDGQCLPIGGNGSPATDCPKVSPSFVPYHGNSELDGCCTPNGVCGFVDDMMGLGCVPAEYYGVGVDEQITCDPNVGAK